MSTRSGRTTTNRNIRINRLRYKKVASPRSSLRLHLSSQSLSSRQWCLLWAFLWCLLTSHSPFPLPTCSITRSLILHRRCLCPILFKCRWVVKECKAGRDFRELRCLPHPRRLNSLTYTSTRNHMKTCLTFERIDVYHSCTY